MSARSLMGKINNFIDRIEKNNTHTGLYLATFFCIVMLRNFLEVFSDNTEVMFVRFAHYTLCYVGLFGWLAVMIHVLSKKPMKRILKAVCTGGSIILLAPLIDMFITGGEGLDIAYILPQHYPNLLTTFVSFFGTFTEMGATIGVQAEAVLAMVVISLYVFSYSQSYWRAMMGGLCTYIIIFFFFSIPYIISIIWDAFGREIAFSDIVMVRILLLVAIPPALYIAYQKHKRYFLAILKDARPLRMSYYILLMILGALYAIHEYEPAPEAIFIGLFATISLVCAFLFSIITNNIADREIDSVCNRERPSIRGSIPETQYRHIAYVMFSLSVIFILPLGFPIFFLMLLFIASYFLYSMPPLRLKRLFLVSKLPIGLNTLLMILVGFSLVQKTTVGAVNPRMLPAPFYVITLIGVSLIAHLIDLKDVSGDRADGIRSLPVVLGMRPAQYILGGAILGFYTIVPLFWYRSLLIPMGTFGMLIALLLIRRSYAEKWVFAAILASMVYIIMYLIFLL